MRPLLVSILALVLLACGGGGGGATPTPATGPGSGTAPTLTLGASAPRITLGNPVTLTWTSSGATTVTASGAWSGTKATSGSEAVTPTTTGSVTYTLVASGNGLTTTSSATVTVDPVPTPQPTATISATPSTVHAGDIVTVTWSTTNATSIEASGSWSGPQAASGTTTVTASTAGTLTFNIAASAAGATTANASATVTVLPPATPTIDLSASANSADVNTQVTLTWSSTNTSSLVASGSWSGTKATSGSEVVTVTAAGANAYTLSTPDGTVVKSIVVTGTTPTPTQVAIPDPAFEQALVDLGYDDVVDGYISSTKALAVTDITISSPKNIQSIAGIEAFTNLQHLQIEHQKLTSVDLSKNVNLLWISLWDNLLTTLDVTKLTKLQLLGTSYNDIKTLDLSHNTEIVELDLQHDNDDPNTPWGKTKGLTSLDISACTKLQRLYVGFNLLTGTIDTTHNPVLSEVWAENNQLTSLDFSSNHSGYVFDLYNNNLSYLNVKGCSNGVPRTLATQGNPNLLQIKVDDPAAIAAWAAQYPGWYVKDPWTTYVQ